MIVDIKINVVGEIISGPRANWFIMVQDDTENTGGYFVLEATTFDPNKKGEGYDNWFENLKEVKQYLIYKNLHIKWID